VFDKAVEQGRLSLNVRLFADERDRQVVTGLTHQFLLTLLGAASGIVAPLLLGAPGGPKITPHRQPLSGDRLRPGHRRQHPRAASALHDLQEPIRRQARLTLAGTRPYPVAVVLGFGALPRPVAQNELFCTSQH
jgi:hypothetical protein